MTKEESDAIQQKISERIPLASPGEQAIIGVLTLIAGKLESIEMRIARMEKKP